VERKQNECQNLTLTLKENAGFDLHEIKSVFAEKRRKKVLTFIMERTGQIFVDQPKFSISIDSFWPSFHKKYKLIN